MQFGKCFSVLLHLGESQKALRVNSTSQHVQNIMQKLRQIVFALHVKVAAGIVGAVAL